MYLGISMVWLSLPEEINHQWPTTTTITTMAAAARNGPLPPHTRYNFECLHIGLIGDDHRTSKYAFLWQWEGLWPSNALMMRQWWWWISPRLWSILRVIDPLIAREKYIRLLGGSSPIPTQRSRVSCLLCVTRAVSGDSGHGDGGCCWPLAVGCSVLMSGQIPQ